MNILAVTNLYPRPDRPQAGIFNAQLFRAMSAGHGLEVLVLVPEWRVWRWAAIRGWRSPLQADASTRYQPVFYIPVVGRRWSAKLYAWSARTAIEHFRATQVVFSSWLFPDGVMASRMAASAGRPAWMMALGTDTQHLEHPARRSQIVAACEHATGVVCVGTHLAQRLIAAGVSRERVHVVPNGVDVNIFKYRSPDAARRELGSPALIPGARIVLFVGNLVEVKAPDLLLAAFAHLSQESSQPIQLVFLGTGRLQCALQSQAERLEIDDRILFGGSVAHAQVAMWMNVADVMCLCSRSEGMPNVILEALASGLPVVATDVGACREMVAGEAAARLVPPGDSTALANALRDLLAAEPDRVAMAARHGRRSWQDQAHQLIRLIST